MFRKVSDFQRINKIFKRQNDDFQRFLTFAARPATKQHGTLAAANCTGLSPASRQDPLKSLRNY